jgi:hypothetical protein
MDATNDDKHRAIMDHHLSALDGPLACERMVDVFEELVTCRGKPPRPTARDIVKSWWWANKRRVKKRFRGYLTDMSHNRDEFLQHRYPGISSEELRAKISQFQAVLGDRQALKVDTVFRQFYRISAG